MGQDVVGRGAELRGAGRHWGNILGAERRGAGGLWGRRSVGQDVVGQNFVGQDVTGAISLGQEVSGAGGSGAGSRESIGQSSLWKF